jgi:tetratricopeptide (TPR) repeat protein
MADIDAAIFTQKTAVELTPDDHPRNPRHLSNLGNLLLTRFERYGEVSDIDGAIRFQKDSVRLMPDGHPDKRNCLDNLGNTLLTRFERFSEMADIDAAVSSQRDAVRLTPDDHPSKPGHLNNLGNSLTTRFEHFGEVEDINLAISSQQKAIHLTPDDNPDKASYLNNLGNSLMNRFERFHNAADIDATISSRQDAVRLEPIDSPFRAGYLLNLGVSLFIRAKGDADSADFHQSILLLREAADQKNAPPLHRFDAASQWAEQSRGCNPSDAMLAYKQAIDLLPRVAWHGASVGARHHALSKAGNVVCDAAAHAIQLGDPRLAVELLEQGRSVVWGQMLQLRTPLDDLRISNKEFAERLEYIGNILAQGGSDRDTANDDIEELGRRNRQLADEWDELVSKVRSLAGFEDFLLPKKIKDFSEVASEGPIVMVNISQYRCDALVCFLAWRYAVSRFLIFLIGWHFCCREHFIASLRRAFGNCAYQKRLSAIFRGRKSKRHSKEPLTMSYMIIHLLRGYHKAQTKSSSLEKLTQVPRHLSVP